MLLVFVVLQLHTKLLLTKSEGVVMTYDFIRDSEYKLHTVNHKEVPTCFDSNIIYFLEIKSLIITRDDSRCGPQSVNANYGNLDTYEALTGVQPTICETCKIANRTYRVRCRHRRGDSRPNTHRTDAVNTSFYAIADQIKSFYFTHLHEKIIILLWNI